MQTTEQIWNDYHDQLLNLIETLSAGRQLTRSTRPGHAQELVSRLLPVRFRRARQAHRLVAENMLRPSLLLKSSRILHPFLI
jgi:hypothetical protein